MCCAEMREFDRVAWVEAVLSPQVMVMEPEGMGAASAGAWTRRVMVKAVPAMGWGTPRRSWGATVGRGGVGMGQGGRERGGDAEGGDG